MESAGLTGLIFASWTLGAACVPIHSNQTVKVVFSRTGPVCLRVAVDLGDVAQIRVDQSSDLVLRVVGQARELVIDGFDFGPETVTLDGAASYDIYASFIRPNDNSKSYIIASRRIIPRHNAESWQKAEALASESKRSEGRGIAESLLAWREVGDISSIARTFLKQGSHALRSDFLGARASFEQALTLCKSIFDSRCMAEAANNSGLASLRLGELEPAIGRMNEAVEDWRRSSHSVFEGRTLQNLGFLFTVSGDYQRAIASFSRAEPLLSGRDPLAHSRLLNNLGVCYQYLAEYERSAGLFQRALVRFENLKQPRDALRARLNLGRTYMLQGRLQGAHALLDQALAEAMKHSDASGRADVLNNLGQVLLKLSRLDEAQKALAEALEVQRALRSRRGEAIALHMLGLEARHRGDMAAARRFLAEALKLREKVGLRDDASESSLALAEVFYATGDFAPARELADRALGSIELLRGGVSSIGLRASYYARKRAFFDLLVDVAMAGGAADSPALGLLEAEQGRGRALLDIVARGPAAGRLPGDLLVRRRDLERRVRFLADRLSASGSPREQGLQDQLDQALMEADSTDSEIALAFEAQQLSKPLRSLEDLQSGLPPDTALLEYHLGERASCLWLVTRDHARVFRLPPRAAVESLASRTVSLLAAIGERLESPKKQAEFEWGLNRLSTILLGPLEGTALPPRIIFVLDGVLNRAPMSALRLNRRAIGLSHDVMQAPSAAYLLAGRVPRTHSEFRGGVLALADPVYSSEDPRVTAGNTLKRPAGDTTLRRLPFLDDLKTIGSLLPPSRFVSFSGFQANASILRQTKIEEYGILHFSTHTIIDERNPEESRVILSLVDSVGRPIDGFFTPAHFAQLSLNGPTVVLSSCETALGRMVIGEGLQGFTHSLFQAGASQLVLSLAKTEAVASAQFFSEFYRWALARRPVSIERAVTMARRRMAADSRWSDPFYWAVFTVIGRPSPGVAAVLPKL